MSFSDNGRKNEDYEFFGVYGGETINSYNTVCNDNLPLWQSRYPECNRDKHDTDILYFKERYHSLGNFMPIGKMVSLKGFSLNTYRGSVNGLIDKYYVKAIENGICDFFDLFLVWVKEWYDANGNEAILLNSKNWRKLRFDIFLLNHESYFEKFGTFGKYCEFNFLNNYIDKNNVVQAMFGDLNNRRLGGKDAVPKNDTEITQFLDKSVRAIKVRAEKMAAKLETIMNGS